MAKVTPATATIKAGKTARFNADAAVTWSVKSGGTGGGTIDQIGLYTNSTAGEDTVVATPKDGSAPVEVTVTAT